MYFCFTLPFVKVFLANSGQFWQFESDLFCCKFAVLGGHLRTFCWVKLIWYTQALLVMLVTFRMYAGNTVTNVTWQTWNKVWPYDHLSCKSFGAWVKFKPIFTLFWSNNVILLYFAFCKGIFGKFLTVLAIWKSFFSCKFAVLGGHLRTFCWEKLIWFHLGCVFFFVRVCVTTVTIFLCFIYFL